MFWSKLYQPLLKQLGLWGGLNLAVWLFFHYGIYFIIPFKSVHSYKNMSSLFDSWESKGLIKFILNLPTLLFGKWYFFDEQLKSSGWGSLLRYLIILEIFVLLVCRRLIWLPVLWTFQLATAWSLWSHIGFPNLNKLFDLINEFEPEFLKKVRGSIFKLLNIDQEVATSSENLDNIIESKKTLFDYFKEKQVVIKESIFERTSDWFDINSISKSSTVVEEIGDPEPLPTSYKPLYVLWGCAFGAVLLIGGYLYIQYKVNNWFKGSSGGPSYDGFDPSNPGYTEYNSKNIGKSSSLRGFKLPNRTGVSSEAFQELRDNSTASTSKTAQDILSSAPKTVSELQVEQASVITQNRTLQVNTGPISQTSEISPSPITTQYRVLGQPDSLPLTNITLDGISIDRRRLENAFHYLSNGKGSIKDYLSGLSLMDDQKEMLKKVCLSTVKHAETKYLALDSANTKQGFFKLPSSELYDYLNSSLDQITIRDNNIEFVSPITSASSEASMIMNINTPEHVKDNALRHAHNHQFVNREIKAHVSKHKLGLPKHD
jgi:hypothetical protein